MLLNKREGLIVKGKEAEKFVEKAIKNQKEILKTPAMDVFVCSKPNLITPA